MEIKRVRPLLFPRETFNVFHDLIATVKNVKANNKTNPS